MRERKSIYMHVSGGICDSVSKRVPTRRALRLMTDDWIDSGWYSAQTVMDMRDILRQLLRLK